ncbi:hypothetical protein ACOMHN_007284 [Nucella lapillus]
MMAQCRLCGLSSSHGQAVPDGLQMMAQCRLCGLSSSHGQAVPDGLQMMAQCRLCGLSLICMARQFLMDCR